LNRRRPPRSRSTTWRSDHESKPPFSSTTSSSRTVEPGHHVWPAPIEQQPLATINWSPCLGSFLLITAHWTVRATRPKCPTPPIQLSIAAVLHLVPCPSADSLCDLARCGTHPSRLHVDLLPGSGSGTTC
jgi:hypothetical protein